jgi:hypothetical protein
MCRKLISQIIATSVSMIRTLDRQKIDHDEQIKPQQDESVPKGGVVADSYTRQTRQIDHDAQIKPQQDKCVPKGGAVAGGNRCIVILWISHTNRGRTSVDVGRCTQCSPSNDRQEGAVDGGNRCVVIARRALPKKLGGGNRVDVGRWVVRRVLFPKNLFAFSQCRIAKTTVPETYSLVHKNDRAGV